MCFMYRWQSAMKAYLTKENILKEYLLSGFLLAFRRDKPI